MNSCKPILFTAPEVRAILDGHKTQTRRVVKPANPVKSKRMGGYKQGDGLWIDGGSVKDYSISPCWQKMGYYMRDYAPCQPGDILWVRETWTREYYSQLVMPENSPRPYNENAWRYIYRATDELPDGCKWRPSIHMPREAARIFLRVTDVRVERVQEISETDARAEGIKSYWHTINF